MTESLLEDHIAVLRQTLLELLLEITASMLVLTKRGYLPREILEASASKAVDCDATSKCQHEPQSCSNAELTLAVNLPTLMLRPVQAVHLVLRAI